MGSIRTSSLSSPHFKVRLVGLLPFFPSILLEGFGFPFRFLLLPLYLLTCSLLSNLRQPWLHVGLLCLVVLTRFEPSPVSLA